LDSVEDFWALCGEFGEDLAVQFKSVLLQLREEDAVGLVACFADGGVEAHNPELAEDGLLVAAVSEGVAAGAHKRFVREVELLGADAAIALRSLEDILTALIRVYSTFDSCHIRKVNS